MLDANLNTGPTTSRSILPHEDSETKIVDVVDKRDFYRRLKQFGVCIDVIATKDEMSDSDILTFNKALHNCCTLLGMNIADCVLFLEQDCEDCKRLVGVLNAENRALLTSEMAKRYHIHLKKNTVAQAFDVE
jgi:hypothetical protein